MPRCASQRFIADSGSFASGSILTDAFLPVFAAEFKKLKSDPGWTWLQDGDTRVIAAGHSLGGGLAQKFAYSTYITNKKYGIPVVKEVFAFDPSPVSGKHDGSSELNPSSFKGLKIYRIYNRGEPLAGLRVLERFVNPGQARNNGQTWIDIRYAANWSWRTRLPPGSVHAHGMHDLARFMIKNLPPAEKPQCNGSEDL